MVPLSIGAQTSGSVIRPASYCGVLGIKPTYGLVSCQGVLPASRTLDTMGAFARAIDDLALLLDVVAEDDASDIHVRLCRDAGFRASLAKAPHVQPKVGFVRTPMWDQADAEAREALEALGSELGAWPLELPDFAREAWSVHSVIFAAELAGNLGPAVTAGADVSDALRIFVEQGLRVTPKVYERALGEAKRLKQDLQRLFDGVDGLITLSAAGVAPEGLDATGDPVFCALWTLAGYPAANLPLLADRQGLPIGVQIVCRPYDDSGLLRLMANISRGRLYV
jgi:Asp-tRNA(Asn)/Glu-tRNA(Gln) amidotransferase A subunit family amidase